MTSQTLDILSGIDFNDEGYMTNPAQWSEDIAAALAQQEGIELTDKHWEIIRWCRQAAAESGKAPTLRQITKGTGTPTKELFKLFPKGPAKKVAKIAGLGKPEGCI